MFSTRNYAVYDVSNIRQYVMVVLNEHVSIYIGDILPNGRNTL